MHKRFANLLIQKKSIIYLFLLCGMVIALSTKGITDENVVSMNGDMPRYMMNGVYFYDLLRDFPVANPLEHAYLYFAQYPALSLGHHPLLLGITELPLYALFGISVYSARLCIIFFTLVSVVGLYFLVRLIYDDSIAFLASALLATTPFFVQYSRIVMPEMQAIALIVLSAFFFYKYCQRDKKLYAFAAIMFFVLSLYAKHLAVFILPAFLLYLAFEQNLKKLWRKEVIIYCVIAFGLLLPLAYITLKFSQSNVQWVAHKSFLSRLSFANLGFYPSVLGKYHLTLPVLILSIISIVAAIFRWDKRALLFLCWILGLYFLLISLGVQKEVRHGIYWIPAFCVFAAAVVNFSQKRYLKIGLAGILVAVVCYQFIMSYELTPQYASGYEKAAKYVVDHRKGDSILYGCVDDTGYFIFFVRKYDHDRQSIILRTDKILATSKLDRIVADKVNERREIYQILDSFGVAYIVLEDKAVPSHALELFRQEVKTSPKFKLIREIPIRSDLKTLDSTPLKIYEYVDHKSAADGKMVNMDIPLIGDSIHIPFNKLFKKKSTE